MTETRRRPGRRPGGVDTRGEVLAAARTEFATKGFDGASVRGIARLAGVDAALVHHYFGTKEQLVVAAMHFPLDPSTEVPALFAGGLDGLGVRVVRVEPLASATEDELVAVVGPTLQRYLTEAGVEEQR